MKEAQKEWAGAAVTARPEVGFRGENNMHKRTEAGAKAQGKRRNRRARMPLALTIKEDEEITIGPDVSMRFHPDYEHSRGRLRWRICIDAPPEIQILRRPAVPLPEGAGLVLR